MQGGLSPQDSNAPRISQATVTLLRIWIQPSEIQTQKRISSTGADTDKAGNKEIQADRDIDKADGTKETERYRQGSR